MLISSGFLPCLMLENFGDYILDAGRQSRTRQFSNYSERWASINHLLCVKYIITEVYAPAEVAKSLRTTGIKMVGTRGFEPRTPTVSRCFRTLRTARIRS